MADNITLNSGTGGATIAADDITSVWYQRVKLTDGTADSTTPINSGGGVEANALRVTIANDSTGVVSVDDNGASLTVDNAALSVVGGGTEAAALRVTLASDSTGVLSIDDNGGAITVDGTVSVSGVVDVTPVTPAANDYLPVRLTDGSAFLSTTAIVDDAAFTPGTSTVSMMGFEFDDVAPDSVNEGDAGAARMSANRCQYVMLRDNAGNERGLNVDASGQIAITNAGITTIAGAVSGTEMQVDILTIAAGDNNIGNVDIVTMPNVTLAAGTNTNEVVGDVAHDAAAAGNPVGISGVAQNMDDTAPPNRVSAEGDSTRLATSWDGAIFAHPHGPQIWSYHVNGSSALTDTTVHASPGAGLSLYVTDIVISSGAATAMNAFFEEGASTVLGPYYLEAVAGRGCAIHFGTPKKITAATALTITTSAAIAHSVDVTGFVAPG